MVGREDEPGSGPKVERVLPGAVCCEGVQATRRTSYIGQRWGGTEHGEATSEYLPLLGAEATQTGAIRSAILGEFPVCPGNVNCCTP